MQIPFCPDSKVWTTKQDEVVTVSELLSGFADDVEDLHITGSQKNDYNGASCLFSVPMKADLAVKFFGNCQVFNARFYYPNGVNVVDGDHLAAWAKENGLFSEDEIRAKFSDYKRRYPHKCFRDSYIRISV